MSANTDFVRNYLRILSDLESPQEELAALLHDEVQQVEYPNLLVKTGATRGKQQMLEGFERGKKVTSAQSFDVTRVY